MKTRIFALFLLLTCFACTSENAENSQDNPDEEVVFDEAQWKTRVEGEYLYRDQMLNDVVYNDTIRSLSKNEILDLLGEPDRVNENFLYYTISRKRLGFWTLHAKTMVIKLSEDNTSLDWIKIHE